MCIKDVDLPAVRWVLADRGILWLLRLLSGQTCPAVLSVQTHHHCPVGGQKLIKSKHIYSDPPLAEASANASSQTLWNFSSGIPLPRLILFKVIDYIQAHTVEGGSMPVFKHRLGQTVYLNAFSEGHFMAISFIHQFSTPTRGHEGAEAFPRMHPGQVSSLN